MDLIEELPACLLLKNCSIITDISLRNLGLLFFFAFPLKSKKKTCVKQNYSQVLVFFLR